MTHVAKSGQTSLTKYWCPVNGEQGSSVKSVVCHKRTVLSEEHVAKTVLEKAILRISAAWAVIVHTLLATIFAVPRIRCENETHFC